MSRTSCNPSRILGAALLVCIAVAYAMLFNPIVQAQGLRTCTLAANPCTTCDSMTNRQCLLSPGGYQWGYCSMPQNKICNDGNWDCSKAEQYNCASPPQDLMQKCGPTNAYTVCKY